MCSLLRSVSSNFDNACLRASESIVSDALSRGLETVACTASAVGGVLVTGGEIRVGVVSRSASEVLAGSSTSSVGPLEAMVKTRL